MFCGDSHFDGARATCPRIEPGDPIEGGAPSLRGLRSTSAKDQNEGGIRGHPPHRIFGHEMITVAIWKFPVIMWPVS